MNLRGYSSLIVGAAMIVSVVAGCQIVVADRNIDEIQVRILASTFVEAAQGGDIDAVMNCFAEDFRGSGGMDKKGLRYRLQDAVGPNTEFSADDLKITFSDGGRTAEIKSISVDYTSYISTAAKRDGKWIIVGSR